MNCLPDYYMIIRISLRAGRPRAGRLLSVMIQHGRTLVRRRSPDWIILNLFLFWGLCYYMTLPFLKQCVLALSHSLQERYSWLIFCFYTSIGLITCYETYTFMPLICLVHILLSPVRGRCFYGKKGWRVATCKNPYIVLFYFPFWFPTVDLK